MTRHELREAVFRNVFQIPFYEDDIPELEEEDFADCSDEDRDYITTKVDLIKNNIKDIDDTIEKNSKGWKTKRLGKAELAILRVAVYEIKYDKDIPDKVAVNEAIVLAKAYCDDKAPAFINGVLSGLIE